MLLLEILRRLVLILLMMQDTICPFLRCKCSVLQCK